MKSPRYPSEALRRRLVVAGILESQHSLESLASLMPVDFDLRSYESMSADVMAELLLYLIAKGFISLPQATNQVLLDMPWGSHICQFYKSKQDLLDLLVPYFKQGLEHNEACTWVVADLTVHEATSALAAVVPDLEERMATGQMDIRHYTEFHARPDGTLKALDTLMDEWERMDSVAAVKGFDGVRASGDTAWIDDENSMAGFLEYESKAHCAIHNSRMMAVCTYPARLAALRRAMDLVHSHAKVLVKRGEWVHRIDRSKDAEKIQALFHAVAAERSS